MSSGDLTAVSSGGAGKDSDIYSDELYDWVSGDSEVADRGLDRGIKVEVGAILVNWRLWLRE